MTLGLIGHKSLYIILTNIFNPPTSAGSGRTATSSITFSKRFNECKHVQNIDGSHSSSE